MRILKIFLVSFFVLLALLLAAAVILPRVYKDDLLAVIREEGNKNLNASLDFTDIDLSLFRRFPRLSVRIDSLSLTGKGPFDGYPLLRCASAEVAVSVWDLLSKSAPLRIRDLRLTSPDIRILILEDGSANYDLSLVDTTAQETPEESSVIQGAIQHYALSDGNIRYEDRTMPLLFDVRGLNHEGSGDFTQDRFILSTSTHADSLTLDYDGMAYLHNARADMTADLDIDLSAMRFAFRDNRLVINELELNGRGEISMPGDAINMDLAFTTPQSDLRHLWSVVPGAFTKDYSDLESSGTFTLDAQIRGTYDSLSFPSFAIVTSFDQGRIKYPALPAALEDLSADIRIEQPGNRLEDMAVRIPKFALRVKGESLSGRFSAEDIFTDPNVDLEVKGGLDLAAWHEAFPIEADELSGLIRMDVAIRARMSDLDAGLVDRVDLHGQASINQLHMKSAGQPTLDVPVGGVSFSPQSVRISDLQVKAGRSDLTLNARIDNILAILHPERTMKGDLNLRSSLLDLDEWVGPGDTSPASSAGSDEAPTLPVEQYDLHVSARIDHLIQGGMDVRNLALEGAAGPTILDIANLSGNLGESDFRMQGRLAHLTGWLAGKDILEGELRLESSRLDLNALMPATEEAAAPGEGTYAPILVPSDVRLTASAKVGHLTYTDLDLKQVDGDLQVADQELRLNRLEAAGLGGNLSLAGAYNTSDPAKPSFRLKYDLKNMDFQQVFQKFNSFRALAPIGTYIRGNFNSNLVMDGILGKDMMPDLTTLDAAGFLETFHGLISGFKPVEGLADKLNIRELRNLDLQGTKNWFEVHDGTLELKDFDYIAKGITMTIGGKHSLTQDMAYHVKARIPRKLMEKTPVASTAEAGMKWLESEAARKGLSTSFGETVNLLVEIGGSLKAPTYRLQLLGSDGSGASIGDQVGDQVGEVSRQVKDSLEKVARQKMEDLRNDATKKAEKALDSLKRQAEKQVDTTLAKAKAEAAKKAEEVLGKEAEKKIEEIGGDKAKQEADKIKEKLKQWDPFKKKDGQ